VKKLSHDKMIDFINSTHFRRNRKERKKERVKSLKEWGLATEKENMDPEEKG
jgi:hypothetical protein